MAINSKQKGKRGETSWVHYLKEHGFENSRRSQQYCGSESSADVLCTDLPNYHFEVKFTESFRVYGSMNQAIRDCGDKTPIVAYRKVRGEWLVVMRADDWLNLEKGKMKDDSLL